MRRYAGIDLHRRRSVIFTMDGEANRLGCKRIVNDPEAGALHLQFRGEAEQASATISGLRIARR